MVPRCISTRIWVVVNDVGGGPVALVVHDPRLASRIWLVLIPAAGLKDWILLPWSLALQCQLFRVLECRWVFGKMRSGSRRHGLDPLPLVGGCLDLRPDVGRVQVTSRVIFWQAAARELEMWTRD